MGPLGCGSGRGSGCGTIGGGGACGGVALGRGCGTCGTLLGSGRGCLGSAVLVGVGRGPAVCPLGGVASRRGLPCLRRLGRLGVGRGCRLHRLGGGASPVGVPCVMPRRAAVRGLPSVGGPPWPPSRRGLCRGAAVPPSPAVGGVPWGGVPLCRLVPCVWALVAVCLRSGLPPSRVGSRWRVAWLSARGGWSGARAVRWRVSGLSAAWVAGCPCASLFGGLIDFPRVYSF